jgi:hypothetical protein
VLPAILHFPPGFPAAVQGAPVPEFTAVFTLALVRGRERFVGQAAVNHPEPAFSLPPVILDPPVLSNPAFTGAAAAVIPAHAGFAAASALAIPGFFGSVTAAGSYAAADSRAAAGNYTAAGPSVPELFLFAGCSLLIVHAYSSCLKVQNYRIVSCLWQIYLRTEQKFHVFSHFLEKTYKKE